MTMQEQMIFLSESVPCAWMMCGIGPRVRGWLQGLNLFSFGRLCLSVSPRRMRDAEEGRKRRRTLLCGCCMRRCTDGSARSPPAARLVCLSVCLSLRRVDQISRPPSLLLRRRNMFRNQYDTDITTFSPAGRLHQVSTRERRDEERRHTNESMRGAEDPTGRRRLHAARRLLRPEKAAACAECGWVCAAGRRCTAEQRREGSHWMALQHAADK